MPYHLPSVYWRTPSTSAYLYPPAHSASGGSAVPPQAPFVAPAGFPATALTLHWLSGGSSSSAPPIRAWSARRTASPSFFLPPQLQPDLLFQSLCHSICTPKKQSHGVLISQDPTPTRQHLGRLCTQGLRSQRSHPKSLYTLRLAPALPDPGRSIYRWSGNTGAVRKSSVKGKLLGQEGL